MNDVGEAYLSRKKFGVPGKTKKSDAEGRWDSQGVGFTKHLMEPTLTRSAVHHFTSTTDYLTDFLSTDTDIHFTDPLSTLLLLHMSLDMHIIASMNYDFLTLTNGLRETQHIPFRQIKQRLVHLLKLGFFVCLLISACTPTFSRTSFVLSVHT